MNLFTKIVLAECPIILLECYKKRAIIVEVANNWNTKDMDKEGSFDLSILKWGESLGTIFLANQSGSKIICSEPTEKDTVLMLLKDGYSKDEIAIFLLTRDVISITRRKDFSKDKDITEELSWRRHSNMDQGLDLFKLLNSDNARESVQKMAKRANELLESFGIKKFFVIEDDKVKLNVNKNEINNFINPVLEDKENKITNLISRSEDVRRNARLLESIDAEVELGNSPLIVYGNGHLLALKPALDYLYGSPIFQN